MIGPGSKRVVHPHILEILIGFPQQWFVSVAILRGGGGVSLGGAFNKIADSRLGKLQRFGERGGYKLMNYICSYSKSPSRYG